MVKYGVVLFALGVILLGVAFVFSCGLPEHPGWDDYMGSTVVLYPGVAVSVPDAQAPDGARTRYEGRLSAPFSVLAFAGLFFCLIGIGVVYMDPGGVPEIRL